MSEPLLNESPFHTEKIVDEQVENFGGFLKLAWYQMSSARCEDNATKQSMAFLKLLPRRLFHRANHADKFWAFANWVTLRHQNRQSVFRGAWMFHLHVRASQTKKQITQRLGLRNIWKPSPSKCGEHVGAVFTIV